MLRKIRIILGGLMFVLVTLVFLGISWGFVTHSAWVARIQFLPALLSVNFGVLAGLIVLTLLLGRVYCSIVCPLGVMQDCFAWLGKKQKKNRYSYSSEKTWLRYGVLIIFLISLFAGFNIIVNLLAPYSSYGRIVNSLFRPLYDMLQNFAASIDMQNNGYNIAFTDIWMRSIITLVVAIVTFLSLFVLAWRNGRTYCNTICPVGTILGFFSRFSLFRVLIDKSKCKNCSLCEKNCKASAIDYQSGVIDYSRCVVCGDCTNKCRFDALSYSWRFLKQDNKEKVEAKKENGSSDIDAARRSFLVSLVSVSSSVALAKTTMKVDGGLAVIDSKRQPYRERAVVPPGAGSLESFSKHCTACQLCVSACPNGVLRPSKDPLRFMQPEMSYERGWCRPECTRCSSVCPTGAIRLIDRTEKTMIHVGHAVWIKSNCIPVVNGDSCGSCASHCPSHAIFMVDYKLDDGRIVKVPSVDTERCIGCGACEYLCPARPFSAIYVEGKVTHIID